MIGKHWYLVCALMLSLLAGPGARAQAPSIPPDIQALITKAKSGEDLTKAETARLQQWAQSMRAGSGGASAASAASGNGAPSAAAQGSATPCPPASASLVTAAAPTRAEYVVLVKSLAETYGRKLGAHRAEFDRIFAKPGAASSAAQAGPVLYISGAAGASVYASAVAAAAKPDDLQVASNLGVALDTIPDAKAASAVLLYARKLAPQRALPALNLAWVYFNSGHTAEAQALFQNAALLDPDLSGPSAGLGMLANCKGDTATAMSMFRKSLSKSYSGVVAVGYTAAQQAEEQQQQSSNQPPPSFPPSGSADSSPLPELPVTADPQETLGSASAFQQAMNFSDTEMQAAVARFQDAQARVSAIVRRAQIDPDGTIDLPRLFDKQRFEFFQIVGLTFGTVAHESLPTLQQAQSVTTPANQQNAEAGGVDLDTIMRLERDLRAAEDAKDEARAAADQAQIDALAYKMCKRAKETLDTNYAQYFKVWKQYSDSSRAASRDLYAYSQPILDQIWVPSLNEVLQAGREMRVLNLYHQDAGWAGFLADLAKGSKELKCIPPEPPKPPKTVKDPTLTRKKPDCPLNPPLIVNLVAIKMVLGCDAVKISGGEILQVEVERNFVKKTTAFSAGLGVSASLPSISLGGDSLGDNGKSWTPPSGTPTAEAGAQLMATVRVTESGAVDDLSFKSTVQASGSVGSLSGAIGMTGTVSLENGANVTPTLNGSAGK
jgi:tetratricopeptide (TPR) repeat protein